MTEEQQYNLVSAFNLMKAALQLLLLPIMGKLGTSIQFAEQQIERLKQISLYKKFKNPGWEALDDYDIVRAVL